MIKLRRLSYKPPPLHLSREVKRPALIANKIIHENTNQIKLYIYRFNDFIYISMRKIKAAAIPSAVVRSWLRAIYVVFWIPMTSWYLMRWKWWWKSTRQDQNVRWYILPIILRFLSSFVIAIWGWKSINAVAVGFTIAQLLNSAQTYYLLFKTLKFPLRKVW